jgi:hypothetical protein
MEFLSGQWSGSLPTLTKAIADYFNKVSVEHRHLIEPAQIIDLNARKPTQSVSQMPGYLIDQVRALLDLKEIDQYETYAVMHDYL